MCLDRLKTHLKMWQTRAGSQTQNQNPVALSMKPECNGSEEKKKLPVDESIK